MNFYFLSNQTSTFLEGYIQEVVFIHMLVNGVLRLVKDKQGVKDHVKMDKRRKGLRDALAMTRQALSVWQSEDKSLVSLKALCKSVCMPFRALAWPKCQSNIWQNPITLLPSLPPWIPSHSRCDVGLIKGFNHSDTAHGVCLFRRPSSSWKNSKMGIEWEKLLTFSCMLLNLLKA